MLYNRTDSGLDEANMIEPCQVLMFLPVQIHLQYCLATLHSLVKDILILNTYDLLSSIPHLNTKIMLTSITEIIWRFGERNISVCRDIFLATRHDCINSIIILLFYFSSTKL